MKTLSLLLGIVTLTLTQLCLAKNEALTIPRAAEIFSVRAEVKNIALSPDGKHYFVLAEKNEDETASIFKYGTNELVHVVNFDRRWKAGFVKWISNTEIAISPNRIPYTRFAQYQTGQLFVIDLDGNGEVVYGSLSKSQASTLAGRRNLPGGAVLMDPLVEKAGWILIEIQDGFRRGYAEFEYKTGKVKDLNWGPNRGCRFTQDSGGAVKYCSTRRMSDGWPEDERIDQIYEWQEDRWNLVYEGRMWERTGLVHALDEQGKYLAYKESDSSIMGIYEYDAEKKTFNELYTPAVFDISGAASSRVHGVGGIGAHDPKPNYLYLESESLLTTVHQQLVSYFPEQYVGITSITDDETKMVVRVSSSTNPGTFYLFDREAGELRYLADVSSTLANLQLQKMEPFEFIASDGLTVHGLFTPGKGSGNRASVVLVHGGPHGPFDRWGYHHGVHFLSQIGYNVIQVNFRGSGGFGREFEEAGHLEWSGKMIDDIVEGVAFVMKKKNLANKACIYGGSYGGFASASAVFRYPDFFRCAAGHVGVYDLDNMFSTGDIRERRDGIDYLKRVLGTDKSKRLKDSPSNNVDLIKVPMLLTHGKQDYRADVSHTRIMEKKLKGAGKDVEVTYVSREMHGFASIENERKRLEQLGGFFSKHL